MTDKRRREIAVEYRKELDRRAKRGELRKSWVPGWLREKGINRATLYRWVKRHG